MGEFLRKLLGFIRPYRGRFMGGIACGILSSLVNGALLLSVKLVVDLVFPGEGQSPTKALEQVPAFLQSAVDWLTARLGAMVGGAGTVGVVVVVSIIPLLMFFRVGLAYLNFYLMQWSAVRAVCDIRQTLFARLVGQPAGFFQTANTGELISRISNDTAQLNKAITGALPALVLGPATVLITLGVLLFEQPRLTLVSLAVLPVCVVPIAIYGRKVRKSSRALQKDFADLTSIMQETFSGHRVVRAYNLETTMIGRFRESTARFISHYMRIARAMELPGNLVEFMGAVGVAIVLVYVALRGGNAAGEGGITPGDFLMFILAVVSLYKPIKEVSKLSGQLEQARAASERVFQYLETKNTVPEPARPKPLRAAGAEVRFESVSFCYGDRPALVDFDLAIHPGQTVALVGRSGSGKTTAMSLLLRFYDPQQGRVTIGGTDLREFSTRDLREQVAVVTQEVVLFNDTIAANIALGKPGATEAEIEAAAKAAFAHGFIMEKPDGYATQVGERGTALSGGQRQRIAIARALIRNAPILLLDEATSALDTESERAVQQALEVLMKGRTTLCIAHRLSTIQNADRIVVMEAGRIVEQGRHEELVQKAGAYLRLQA